MGVKGLWALIEPVARPVRVESLGNKRLAIDASIWLHQFLKAMRDAEGKTLSNAHILGFFRRICKLLFFNIKPVFVFDGGAPTLKRATIRERKERKERTAKNLQKTAEKLLSAQLRLHALNQVKEKEPSQAQKQHENIVTEAGKRKKDAYELPNVETEFRISVEQDKMLALEEGEDYVIHGIDTENIDLDSEVFASLPIEIQQEILLDLKNKSRQTSWNRLESMIRSATTAFDFSQLQIKNLVRRNDLMQRFLESTGATNRTSTVVKGRIASESDREYVLIRNDDVIGGWTMGIKSKKHDPNTGTKETPVKLDSSDEDEEFEEVEVPGISKASSLKPSTAVVPFFNSSLEPVRKAQTNSLVNDMSSYADDDESVEAVMEKFRKLEESNFSVVEKEEPKTTKDPLDAGYTQLIGYLERPPDAALFANEEQVYDYWISQVPPEFKSIFPLYEILLKEAVYDFSEAARDSIILSFTRKLEKTSDDIVSRDKAIAYTFYIAFCRFVNEWVKIWKQNGTKEDASEDVLSNSKNDSGITDIQTDSLAKEGLPVHTPIKKQHSTSQNENSNTRFASQFESSYEAYTSDTEETIFFEESYNLLSEENYSSQITDIPIEVPAIDENDLEQLYNIDFSSSFLQRDPTSSREVPEGSPNTTPTPNLAKIEKDTQSLFIKTSRIESKFFKSPAAAQVEFIDLRKDEAIKGETELPSTLDNYSSDMQGMNGEASISDNSLTKPKEEPRMPSLIPNDLKGNLGLNKPKTLDVEDSHNKPSQSSIDPQSFESPNMKLSTNFNTDTTESEESQLLHKEIHMAQQSKRLPRGGTENPKQSTSVSQSPTIQLDFSDSDVGISCINEPQTPQKPNEPKQTDHQTVEDKLQEEIHNLSTPIKEKADLTPGLTTPTFARSQTELSSGRSEQPLYISPETIKIISSGGMSINKSSIFDHRSQSDTSPTKSRKIIDEPTNSNTTELFDSDDEDVNTHLDEENSEFAQFVSALKNKDLESIHRELENEVQNLNTQIKKGKRDVSDPNNNMISDIQDLLRLFGIPYVVAPMEAEAQCAELLKLSLVDGIVTDDSDVFLFGGTKIYRNMFNQAKFVECYQSSDLEREMKLDQDKLISLAYLLGSDYTEGITGIGVVNAMEILNEWTGEEGLERFKDWWKDLSSISTDSLIRKKLRNILKKCYIPSSFPDSRVREAYIHPMVDSSDQKFQWGIPDLDGLRGYMQDKLRWPESKTDETLIPIIKNINQRKLAGNQTTLDGFLGPSPERTPTHKSARIRDIVSKWVQGSQKSDANTSPTKRMLDSDSTPDQSEEEMEVVPISEPSKTRGRGRGRGRARGTRGATKNRKTTNRRSK